MPRNQPSCSLTNRSFLGDSILGVLARFDPVVPGYTTLVFDTNILLSSLLVFSKLVELMRWTIVIPLPVIVALDDLSSNSSPLDDAAAVASAYISSHLRMHAIAMWYSNIIKAMYYTDVKKICLLA